jgi:7-carboxy-7-deazaguanine synthase
MTVTDVMHEITKVHWGKRQPGLVISGGEPLLQTRALQTLLVELYSLDFFVEIETNGTLVPTFPVFMVGSFNVSPKLRSSGNLIGVRRNFEALKWFVNRAVGRASFKFVCSDEADLREVDDIVRVTEMPPDSVYIMPEGVDPTELIQKAAILSDPVLQRRYNMTTRLHILTFGNQRGT